MKKASEKKEMASCRKAVTETSKKAEVVPATVTTDDGAVSFGAGSPLGLMAGPCVIESRSHCIGLAKKLSALSIQLGIPFVFKASFDKANRSSIRSYRGPGMRKGLDILAEVRERFGCPIVTDIHEPSQAEAVSKVVDIVQIPAFLCRQTDLLLAAGETGAIINVKKMQSMAAEDMAQVIGKIESTGNRRILLTERGESFGYHNLVVDFRNLMILRSLGYPVIFDATHSVQRPGALGTGTGGDSCWVPALARAAVATGACDGLFFETHENPAQALSDGANSIPFNQVEPLWKQVTALAEISRGVHESREELVFRKGTKPPL